MNKKIMETPKRGKSIFVASVVAVVIFVAAVLFIIPTVYENCCKTRVYSDLEEKLDDTVLSANVTIMLYEETVEENITSVDLFYTATGVIFDFDEQYYYVLTAAHVVDSDDTSDTLSEGTEAAETIHSYYYILNSDAPSLSEAREASESFLSLEEYCTWFPVAEIEYISENSDIAILKFHSDEEFMSLDLSSIDPGYGDRIIAIGENQSVLEYHYGKITSKNLKMFETDDGRKDQVLYTNAYVIPGFSGGAVLNENMEIAGITVGGGADFRGRFRYGALIPVSTITEEIESWKAQ
ncbi:MAG: serine protease [Clostridiales bacterium]|nr:serine protease [Clostridiales bacterium]